jgi:hypothetical protein
MHRGYGRGPSLYTPASWPTTMGYYGLFTPKSRKLFMVATTVTHVIGPMPGYLRPLFWPQGIAGNDHTNKPSDKAAMWTIPTFFFWRPAIMTDMVWSSPPSFPLQRTNNGNDDMVSLYFRPTLLCLVVGRSKPTVRQAHVARREIACLHPTWRVT